MDAAFFLPTAQRIAHAMRCLLLIKKRAASAFISIVSDTFLSKNLENPALAALFLKKDRR
jgi:hypothetical protein